MNTTGTEERRACPPVRKRERGRLWLTSFTNVLKTGHCAPTVMRTLLQIRGVESDHMMLAVSGMGGGVGLTESECGCVTSPIMTLGLMFGDETDDNGIPKVVGLGQCFLRRFEEANGSAICGQLAPNKRDFRACFKAMCSSPNLLVKMIDDGTEDGLVRLDEDQREACRQLLRLFSERDFHCAHTVLKRLSGVIKVEDELLRASYGFLGGTVLSGFTCGALTAGVLAVGLEFGGIENSYIRVCNMMRLFMFHTDAAMHAHVNKANHAMNVGYDLAQRFEREFGSTLCNEIIQEDLSNSSCVRNYVSEHRIDKCREICGFVVQRVRERIREGLTYEEPAKKWH